MSNLSKESTDDTICNIVTPIPASNEFLKAGGNCLNGAIVARPIVLSNVKFM